MKRKNQVEIEIGGQTLLCDFDYSPGDPGVTSGPVESCYEPEPEKFSVTWPITQRRNSASTPTNRATEISEVRRNRLRKSFHRIFTSRSTDISHHKSRPNRERPT